MYGSITIDIEDEDLQRIGEILVQHYVEQQLTSATKSTISTKVKAFSLGVLQLLGVMLTLVGANLLTAKLDSSTSNSFNHVTSNNNTFNFCKHFDYGCDRNICWRMCEKEMESVANVGENNKTIVANATLSTWCYTTANPGERDFQQCLYAYECSPCWTYLGPCHSPN